MLNQQKKLVHYESGNGKLLKVTYGQRNRAQVHDKAFCDNLFGVASNEMALFGHLLIRPSLIDVQTNKFDIHS